jgi:comEA protein
MTAWLTPLEEKVIALLVGGLLLGSAILIYKRSHPSFAPELVTVREGPSKAGSFPDPGASNGEKEGEEALVDINTASSAELERLPGIGPVIASRIIEQRAESGPFRSVDGLLAVRGIGRAALERLRPHITCTAGGDPGGG